MKITSHRVYAVNPDLVDRAIDRLGQTPQGIDILSRIWELFEADVHHLDKEQRSAVMTLLLGAWSKYPQVTERAICDFLAGKPSKKE